MLKSRESTVERRRENSFSMEFPFMEMSEPPGERKRLARR